MHRLLKRQLKKNIENPDSLPKEINDLLELISETYINYDEQNKLKKRTVDISSRELSLAIEELEKNKNALDNEHAKVMHSINYAERMQRAILPSKERMQSLFSDHFVLFKPKDVVSGDFFWVQEKDNCVFFAAVDCTGHGVPGAFMSLIGNDLLNELIGTISSNLDVGEILSLLHERICILLDQENTNNKDGMDIVLCKWDRKANKLFYAGAKNPLVYVDSEGLKIIKPDKKSIGGVVFKKYTNLIFTQHEIIINEPISFYLFSDGYQDQFGGPDKKKFMQKRMRELISENHSKSMKQQNDILTDTLEKWRGNEPQIDDVLVMGIRLTPQ